MIQTIDIQEFLNQPPFKTDMPTFCDIESDGLYINCSLVQLRQDGVVHLVTITTDAEAQQMARLIQPLYLVFHNGSYDMGTLKLVPNKIEDTFYLVKIAYPQIQQFSLDVIVDFLGFGYLYEGIDKKAMQKKGFVRGAYLAQEQLRYASADVEALELIYNLPKIQHVMKENSAYRLGIIALLENMEWQLNGLPVLHDTANKYRAKTEAEIKVGMDKLTERVGYVMNPRSPKQVKEYFGTNSSDKATLTRIVINGSIDKSQTSSTGRGITEDASTFNPEQQAVAEAVLEARQAKNDLSKLNNYVFDTMYGYFNPLGAGTSRWSCKGGDDPQAINMQNYPRKFKAVFGVKPESGNIIIAADYATLEIRIACAIMGERNMYKALMNDEDIHKTTASLIYNKPIEEVHSRERSNAKVMNFGLVA